MCEFESMSILLSLALALFTDVIFKGITYDGNNGQVSIVLPEYMLLEIDIKPVSKLGSSLQKKKH